MRTGFALLAAMVVMALTSPAHAQLVKLQGVWDETGKTYQTIDFDLVTGWPIVECTMSDGTGAALQSTAGALHVSVAALPLPVGAATAAKQDAQTALLTTIDADTGILAADPATATLQGTGNTSLATIAGDTTSIDGKVATEVTLAGVCTEATCTTLATEVTLLGVCLESGGNLDTIAGDTTSIDAKIPALGTALTAASLPVNIASDQTVPVSAAALPLPAGAATEASLITRATEATLALVNGKLAVLGQALMAASMPVTIASDQSTLPVSAATLPLPTGAATEATLAVVETNTDFGTVVGGGAEATVLRVTVANDSTGLLSVDDNGASLTVDGTFWQATQPVSAAALPLPTGAATSALQLPDGHNVTVDNAAGAAAVNVQDGGNVLTVDGQIGVGNGAGVLAVNVQDGGNSLTVDGMFWPALGQALMAASSPVVIASNQSTIPVNTATGTVVDSAAAAQDLLWRNVADGGVTADANLGAIPLPLVAGTVVKLYILPVTKQFHEIAITETDSSADYDYTVQVFALNEVPSAAWALADYLSVGALVVPSYRLSLDRTETVVAQPLVRSHATYLAFVINTMNVSPAVVSPRVRILSYNDGDTR